MLHLSDEIKEIMLKIKEKKFKVYLIGGYVRDNLLGKKTFDIDMTTDATPDSLRYILKDYDLEENFINYGSVKFKYNKYKSFILYFLNKYLNKYKKSMNIVVFKNEFVHNKLKAMKKTKAQEY